MSALFAEIERIDPDRLMIDSVAQIRPLAETSLRYQRQLLALRDLLAGRRTTVVVTDAAEEALSLSGLSHGIIAPDRNIADCGNLGRRMHIPKMRGCRSIGGNHN